MAGSQVEEKDLRRLQPGRVGTEVDECDAAPVGAGREDRPGEQAVWKDRRKAGGRPEPPESTPSARTKKMPSPGGGSGSGVGASGTIAAAATDVQAATGEVLDEPAGAVQRVATDAAGSAGLVNSRNAPPTD